MAQEIKLKEAITVFNNIARRKHLKPIPLDARMTIDQVADKIEAVQHPHPGFWERLLSWRIK